MKDKYLRRFSHWSQGIIALLPLALALPVQAAIELPTHLGGTVHFDLNPGMDRDELPPRPLLPSAPAPVIGGPCNLLEGGFECEFTDSLNNPGGWRAELIIANLGTEPIIDMPLDLVYPGGLWTGKLSLGVGVEHHFDFAAMDIPETGDWIFRMQNPYRFDADPSDPPPINWD